MTDEELKQLVASNSLGIAELKNAIEETNKQMAKTDAKMAKTDAKMAKTDKQVKQLGKQIGELGNKFGRYTEGLFYPSLEKILTKDFNLQNIAYRYKARRNGGNMELDMLGISNGEENKAVLIEIKSQLRDNDLTDLIKTLEKLPEFFPEHKNKNLFGVIAAVGISDEQKRRAEKLGVYVVKISDETFKLVSGKSFSPKNFAAQANI